MTYRTCDVCDHNDMDGGICSSSLGAASFYYCGICIALGAENIELAKFMLEDCGGTWIGYDPELDSYVDEVGAIVPISLKDGRTFYTRAEVVAALQ